MTTVPSYIIDLDLPARQRWAEVVTAYKPRVQFALDSIEREIEKLPALTRAGINVGCGLLRTTGATGGVMYYDDIEAIAELADLPMGRLIAMQLFYEISAQCTAVVAPSRRLGGAPVLVRTMDWEMEFLKPLTVQLHFRRGGRDLFIASTWVGCVGIFTGMAVRPDGSNFGVCINSRHTSDKGSMASILSGLRSKWPTSFIIRHVLEQATSYDHCVGWLRTAKLLAPVYFTICGAAPGQACLVTRGRKIDDMFWTLEAHGPIVQANHDHWDTRPNEDSMESFGRRHYGSSQLAFAMSKMESALEARVTAGAPLDALALEGALDQSLWLLMSEPVICSDLTIYGTAMVPACAYHDTRVPNPLQIAHPNGAVERVFTLFRDAPGAPGEAPSAPVYNQDEGISAPVATYA
jgi:acid ceramidase